MSEWQPIETAPEGIPVMTKIHDGAGSLNEQVMTRKGRLWFAGGMYVYYAPTHWNWPESRLPNNNGEGE